MDAPLDTSLTVYSIRTVPVKIASPTKFNVKRIFHWLFVFCVSCYIKLGAFEIASIANLALWCEVRVVI